MWVAEIRSPVMNTYFLLLLLHLGEQELGIDVALIQEMLQPLEPHLLGLHLPALSCLLAAQALCLHSCPTRENCQDCRQCNTRGRDGVQSCLYRSREMVHVGFHTRSIIAFSFRSPSSIASFSSSSISLVMTTSAPSAFTGAVDKHNRVKQWHLSPEAVFSAAPIPYQNIANGAELNWIELNWRHNPAWGAEFTVGSGLFHGCSLRLLRFVRLWTVRWHASHLFFNPVAKSQQLNRLQMNAPTKREPNVVID